MARVAAVLRALFTALRRDQKSLASVAGNNFFLVCALLLQKAGAFIYLIIGLVLLFPLSTDPLRKIPASRLELWPLDRRERWLLRLASPWVNPLTWTIAALAVWAARGAVTVGLWALIAGTIAVAFLLSDLPIPGTRVVWRLVPALPGPLGQLIRKNIREMLSTLDFYCALILSLATLAWRIAGSPPEALMPVSVLVVLAFSSYAQSLFGLDGRGGLARYRLLPLRGWQILAAKDAAFLLVLIPLTLPLAPLAALGAAFVSLAMGRAESVEHLRVQTRWRFSTGGSIVAGLVQAALMAGAASAILFSSVLFLIPCVGVWIGSTWIYGGRLEQR
jgi:hypothetical protein